MASSPRRRARPQAPATPPATAPQASNDAAVRDINNLSFNLLAYGKAQIPDGAIGSNAAEPEDDFKNFYISATNDAQVIPPPHNLRLLDAKANENNALGPCIEAMVTNIDGTGFDFISRDEKEADDDEDDDKIEELRDFFSQPWPGQSFTTQRRSLRRDVERIGNGYLEVLRDGAGEIAMLRHVDGKMMRLVRLDAPTPVPKTLRRKGRDVTLMVMERERRFVQTIDGRNLIYFAQFGASRDLDKVTGKWAPKNTLPANRRATEIIHFTGVLDGRTPYGLPRWIAQTPSVVGSRKAEEFNSEFFDNGGVPPVMLLLSGGQLSGRTREKLEALSRGNVKDNNRMQVVEVDPSGSFDKQNTAKITVERFGSERQADSMFENYDEKCEVRIRRAYRLPPIFVGQAADYSFATAFASYTVAEAQVFKPERDEFDEVISIVLLPAMGYADYKMRSNALNIEDATLKLEGLQLISSTNAVNPKDFINEVNDTIGTKIKADPAALKRLDNQANGLNPDGSKPAPPVIAAPPGNSNKPPAAGGPKPPATPATPKATPPAVKAPQPGAPSAAVKSDDLLAMLVSGDPIQLREALPLYGNLGVDERYEISDRIAEGMFADVHHDPTGLAELAGCTIAMIAAQHIDRRVS